MLLLFSLRAAEEEGIALRLREMVVAQEGKKRLAAVVPVAILAEAIQVGVIPVEKHLSLPHLLSPVPKTCHMTGSLRCTSNTVIRLMARPLSLPHC